MAFPVPPTTFTAQVSVNPDCTGEVTDETGSADKIVVLDNGNEVLAITWAGFGTSLTTWHRMTRAGDVAPRCGQQTLKGTYAERCEGFALTDEVGSLATNNSLIVFSARQHEAPKAGHGKLEAVVGVARVPDPRVDRLAELYSPKKKTPATVSLPRADYKITLRLRGLLRRVQVQERQSQGRSAGARSAAEEDIFVGNDRQDRRYVRQDGWHGQGQR